ncbi:MAG: hypothetical protein N2Z23_05150 [Pyrinomonadaceae bacterium]|nr:hypothetical protein [Pyrinomonadaceae bacterium]MCX7639812.1 hypothetical protein [Pyrinomonadaceae bacterium]MDW8304395.1 hypothetical protein [Acidobacteriota bacterium]
MRVFLLLILLFYPALCLCQVKKATVYKAESFDFMMGGTVTIIGAPVGSISVEGWQKNEVAVEAEIQIQAENEADISLLSSVTGFILDRDVNHSRVVSVGVHDRNYIKRVARNFPRRLLNLPFRIDYKLKVPAYCDLEINGGKGSFYLQGVDGTISVRFIESGDARMNVSGGAIDAFFGNGDVQIDVLTSSWRGRFLNVGLGSGQLQVKLPVSVNAELQASVLQNGRIDNQFSIKPKLDEQVNDRQIKARLGSGGAVLSFRVANGIIKILQK